MSIIVINSRQDAIEFVNNSGIADWSWGSETSAQGFADWVYQHCDTICSGNYNRELAAYIEHEGESPADYGITVAELPGHDFGYTDLEGVVEQINNSPAQGFEEHTPEYLAAAYAIDALADNAICEELLQPHFDILTDAGAEFDEVEARRLALQ